jgi:hypothetical protein
MYSDEAPDNLDLFVGGMLETTFDGPGPLFQNILLRPISSSTILGSYSILCFMYMFYRSLFVSLYLFPLAIVLSVLLPHTDSDYSFGIFKLILVHCSDM